MTDDDDFKELFGIPMGEFKDRLRHRLYQNMLSSLAEWMSQYYGIDYGRTMEMLREELGHRELILDVEEFLKERG